jgi:biopolymer transport protein ExbB/TolQ
MKTLLIAIFIAFTISGVAMAQEQTTQQKKRSEVTQRQINQQRRIKQGVKSGQLTKGETRRLERQQGRIQARKQKDKAENGGKLTPKNKAQLNRMQNRASRHIYRAKHNAKVQK